MFLTPVRTEKNPTFRSNEKLLMIKFLLIGFRTLPSGTTGGRVDLNIPAVIT